jgi:cell division protein FtsL
MKEFMQGHSTEQPSSNALNVNSKTHTDINVNILIGFSIITPIILLVGFITYKKYRAAVLRKQIAKLEKIWHLDIRKRA